MTASVGVVVPLFNSRDTITSTLASLAGQTRLPERVVVVDDGSTDDSAELVEPWSSHLPLMLLRHKTNLGPGPARCTAIDALDTELVALLDSDDVWLPDALQMLTSKFERHGGLVSGNGLPWVAAQAISRSPWYGRHPVPAAPDQLRRLAIENFVFAGSLFSRSAYLAVGGFRAGPKTCEDWDLWLRLVAAGAVISTPEQPTALYRLRSTSLSAGDSTLDDEIAVLRRLAIEQPTSEVRAATRAGLRHRRARQGLKAAYQYAGEGNSIGARLAGARALQGNTRQVLRGAAMVAAPAWTSRKRAERHADPEWVVDH